jgi:hypothetical protein
VIGLLQTTKRTKDTKDSEIDSFEFYNFVPFFESCGCRLSRDRGDFVAMSF